MKHFFVLIACIALLIAASGTAAAQTNQTATTDDLPDELLEDGCTEPEVLDETTVLCSAELTDGTAELVIRSDDYTRVTITDAGAMLQGGPIPRQTYTVREDEPATIRFDVTHHQGNAGVTIDTGTALYGVPLSEPSTLIGGPWTAQDTQLAAIAAGASTALVSIVVVFRTLLGRTDQPERIA